MEPGTPETESADVGGSSGRGEPPFEPRDAGCEWVVSALGRYFADELQPEARQSVDAHLATCAACRTTTDEYAEVIRLARDLTPPTPPPGVERRLRDLIARLVRSPANERDGALDETVPHRPIQ